MPKAMDFVKFVQWLKEQGYILVESKKHHQVRTKEGKLIQQIAVHHSKGSKRFVKPPYIKAVELAIEKDKRG
jgi:hypothetical protein